MDRDGPQGLGRGRMVLVGVLAVAASGLLFASIAPSLFGMSAQGVAWPDFFLAVGASTAVAAVFFFLAAEFRRAEKRTNEAIGDLREEVSSLKDELQVRSDRRRADAERTADRLLEAGDVQALLQLSEAAVERGFGGTLSVALGGLRQLSLVKVWIEGPTGTRPASYLGIERLTEHVSDPQAPADDLARWFGRQLGMVEVRSEESLADALDSLRQQLEGAQASWPEYAHDAERAMGNLSEAMSVLLSTEEAEIGRIEVVLNERYVLTRTREGQRLLVDVQHVDGALPISPELAAAAEPPDAPDILSHPLVVRHLKYETSAAQEAQRLEARKRAFRAMNK